MDEHNQKVLNKVKSSDRRFKFFLYAAVVVLFATVVASMVFSNILINQLKDIANRIEETQKGSTCILLIKPEDRTRQNVTDCVDNNRTKDEDKDFQFKSDSDPPVSTNSSVKVKVPPTKQPIVVVKPSEPVDSSPLPSVTKPKPVVETKLEVRLSPVTGLKEYRVVGDRFWLVCNGLSVCL